LGELKKRVENIELIMTYMEKSYEIICRGNFLKKTCQGIAGDIGGEEKKLHMWGYLFVYVHFFWSMHNATHLLHE